MDVRTLLEQLKNDRNVAIARERECRKKIKSCQPYSEEELYWEHEYDKAWMESSDLKIAIMIIEKTMGARKGE